METKAETNIGTLGKNISELSSRLKLLDAQKEERYQEISKVNSELNTLLKQASILKIDKQALYTQIQEKKINRDKLNREVGGLATQLKALKDTGIVSRIRNVFRTSMRRDDENVAKIKVQIENLNMTLQTEVLKFEKEQKLMGLIKELKGKLKHAEKEEGKLKEYQSVRAMLRNSKFAADALHKEIQHAAANNSELFGKLAAVSKKIAALKDRKTVLKKEISHFKVQIVKLNKDLSRGLSSWSDAKKKISSFRRTKIDEVLLQKAEKAQEKLKAKKKLTTDDILAMQRKAMDK